MQNTMKEEKPCICKALTTMNSNSNTSLTYYTTPQPKIKIKIPKLLVNTILQKRNHKCKDANNGGQNDSKKKRAKPRLLPKKLSAIIHNVFRNKYSKDTSSCTSSGGDSMVHRRVHCNGDSYNGNKSPNSSSMSRSRSLKEIMGIDDDQKSSRRRQVKSHEKPIKECSSVGKSYWSNGSNGGGVWVMGKRESSSILRRTPSKRLNGYREIMRERSMRKKVTKKFENGSDDEELCKKRILMGEKCKPLHASGTLNYDKNGVLLPEELQR